MTTEVKSCPACGSVHHLNTGPEASGSGVKCGDLEFQQPPYFIRECSTCSLLYKSNIAAPADLEAYYARVDFRRWEIPGHFPTERAALKILGTLPKGSRILDFGCSSGRLLAPLVANYECYGHEINATAAAEAARKGLNMVSAGFLESDINRFDAVVMVDVFEHLTSPTALLRKLYAVLNPGGLLLIVTGNGDFPVCRLDPAQFWYLRTVEHLCMLTRGNAEYLARALEARLEHWQEMSHYEMPLLMRLKKKAQHFSYWQFRNRTFLARTILPLIPAFNRARHWSQIPSYEVGADHVLLGLRKP